MKAVMSNYAAKTFERLTVNVSCRMAILGPSPPYEYPADDQLERVEEVAEQDGREHDEVRQHLVAERAKCGANRHEEHHVAKHEVDQVAEQKLSR